MTANQGIPDTKETADHILSAANEMWMSIIWAMSDDRHDTVDAAIERDHDIVVRINLSMGTVDVILEPAVGTPGTLFTYLRLRPRQTDEA